MNCQKATKLISDAKERKLTLKEKVGLKTHLIVCPYCRNFQQNCDRISRLMQDFAAKDSVK
ncbi:TPA: zf-HC2 domain-containing protein [Mannheimia haemolytica]